MCVMPLEKTSCCFVDHNLSTMNASEPKSDFIVNHALITVGIWIFLPFVAWGKPSQSRLAALGESRCLNEGASGLPVGRGRPKGRLTDLPPCYTGQLQPQTDKVVFGNMS